MITLNKANPTPGEVTSSLTNASDSAGLHFDGVAGYVSCGDSTILDGATKMSMEVIAATSATAAGLVIGKSHASECFYVRFDADGKLRATINNGSSNGTAVSASAYNDGNPKHIVVTWDNATVSIYVNGNLDGTATLAGGSIPNTSDLLGLGAQLHGNGTSRATYFNGIIYRARVWNKALSSTEVTDAYENATVPAGELSASITELAVNGTFEAWNGANTIPDNWIAAPSGSGTITRSTEKYSGTYSAALAVDSGNANCYVQTSAVSLPAGKKIEWSVWMKASSAIDKVSIYAVGDNTMILEPALTTSWQQFTGSYTAKADSKLLLGRNFNGNAASKTIYVDGASAVHRGCVVDLDLSFANPSLSTIVQDRAGAADGTASSSGVTQVTPIEQLNAKAARIGTSAATPADGELAVSGNILVSGADPELKIQDTGYAGFAFRGNANQLDLRNFGTGDVYLTLDSAGNVGIGVAPEAWYAGFSALQLSDTGAIWGENVGGESSMSIGENCYVATDGATKYITTDEASSYQQNNGTHSFRVAASGTADAAITWTDALSIDNTGLATFSAGINLGDENLDTYDEGTFTPTWTPSSGSGQTVSTAVGFYTRIGNRVFIDFTLATNGHGTASGTVAVGGLPFAQAATANQYAIMSVLALDAAITAGESALGYVDYDATTVTPRLWDASTGTSTVTVAEWGVSGTWRFTGSYETDA